MACAAPRNVYVDAGVNWCNTLGLHLQVPEARSRAGEPWLVFGFEASPRIAPFADKCATALSTGQPLPLPPIPPAGSSRELAQYAPQYNCSMADLGLRPKSEHDRKVYRRQKLVPCMLRALEAPLASLVVQPALTSNSSELHRRLGLAASACAVGPRSQYVLVPAAVGKRDGMLSITDGPELMITGGATHQATYRKSRVEKYRVPQVGRTSAIQPSRASGCPHHNAFLTLPLCLTGRMSPTCAHAYPCMCTHRALACASVFVPGRPLGMAASLVQRGRLCSAQAGR